jgi:hypothetical protein
MLRAGTPAYLASTAAAHSWTLPHVAKVSEEDAKRAVEWIVQNVATVPVTQRENFLRFLSCLLLSGIIDFTL